MPRLRMALGMLSGLLTIASMLGCFWFLATENATTIVTPAPSICTVLFAVFHFLMFRLPPHPSDWKGWKQTEGEQHGRSP